MWSNPPLCPNWPSHAAVYPTWQSPWWSQQRAPLPRSLEQIGLSWASASPCSCWTKQRKNVEKINNYKSLGETYFLTLTEISWDSPFAYFTVLALCTERFDLKLHSTLLQKKREEASPSCDVFTSSVWFLSRDLTLPTSWGAGWRATEQGRLSGNWEGETHNVNQLSLT